MTVGLVCPEAIAFHSKMTLLENGFVDRFVEFIIVVCFWVVWMVVCNNFYHSEKPDPFLKYIPIGIFLIALVIFIGYIINKFVIYG